MPQIANRKQKRILEFIQTSIEDAGESPTIRELMRKLRLKSPRAVSYHLDQLEKAGFIRRNGEGKRNIFLIDTENPLKNLVKVPLVGWTTAGDALDSEENILEWVSISARFLKSSVDGLFLLKIRGHSMSPEIEDGNIIIVKKQYTAISGQTIVALLGDKTTVKKYHPSQGHIILKPSNPAYNPIIVGPDELRIQGVVQGVLKYY